MSFFEVQLRVLHVIANLFWIGSIVSVGVLLAAPSPAPRERGILARTVYTRVAVPAFVLSLLAGALRLFGDLQYYFVSTHWMHGKLPLVVGVIALHHIVGARARRLADGTRTETGRVVPLTAVLALCAAVSAWLALAKPF